MFSCGCPVFSPNAVLSSLVPSDSTAALYKAAVTEVKLCFILFLWQGSSIRLESDNCNTRPHLILQGLGSVSGSCFVKISILTT